jgi:heavy metal efflux system protein
LRKCGVATPRIASVDLAVPGVTDPGVFNLLGQPNLVVRIDRAKAARYGFSVGDINAVVQAAIGGQEVTRV